MFGLKFPLRVFKDVEASNETVIKFILDRENVGFPSKICSVKTKVNSSVCQITSYTLTKERLIEQQSDKTSVGLITVKL